MKLKELIFPALILNCIIFTSCDSNKQTDTDPTLPQFGVENNIRPTDRQNDSLSGTIISTQENQNNVALNPPHGEPGHDCSIAVGAPLSNVSNNVPSANTLTTPINSTAQINPPHGQPGHRCEIPVGQPLP